LASVAASISHVGLVLTYLATRMEFAQELNCTCDTSGSASMHVWLNKQLVINLAVSGGKVSDHLRT
jgi:hypothetical protein